MNWPNMLGLIGALIAAGAYVPQIKHLITERCSAGISRSAYVLWFASSVLVTVNALYINAVVFIFLGAVQILSTALIYIYGSLYRGQVCAFHLHHPENV